MEYYMEARRRCQAMLGSQPSAIPPPPRPPPRLLPQAMKPRMPVKTVPSLAPLAQPKLRATHLGLVKKAHRRTVALTLVPKLRTTAEHPTRRAEATTSRASPEGHHRLRATPCHASPERKHRLRATPCQASPEGKHRLRATPCQASPEASPEASAARVKSWQWRQCRQPRSLRFAHAEATSCQPSPDRDNHHHESWWWRQWWQRQAN